MACRLTFLANRSRSLSGPLCEAHQDGSDQYEYAERSVTQ